ncbi:hypothetical protein FSW04_16845 [Baekduia soli]|uniref:Uncharacterized protein n=1 Tax=Baekduia soli TaxID=496014 RepID=A0A5B8U8D8_9ACTN|nr:hypothetical protein [Baekduia soli]QEC49078.1 hypothetical protein FSW04_16845 [Baekduia soli]
MNDSDAEFMRIINGVRLDLETAGNPAHVVAALDPSGTVQTSPIYAGFSHAGDHAKRLLRAPIEGERVFIVTRSEADRRAVFKVSEPGSLRRLFQYIEVVEETYAESEEGPV